MSFHQFFRNLFGFPDRKLESNPERPNDPPRDDFRNPIWNLDDDDDDEDFRTRQPTPFGFRIFSDPSEIHHFFEHQMQQMMRGFQEFHNMFDYLDPSTHTELSIEDLPSIQRRQQESLRDQYLKPGYEPPRELQRRTDGDLDSTAKANGLDSILKDHPILDVVPQRPRSPMNDFSMNTFSQSVTTRIIQQPDGTYEEHNIVKDNQGNVRTTVKRQVGDQICTITTIVDPNGVHKQTEHFINVDEGNRNEFTKMWRSEDQHSLDMENQPRHHKWFPFDKFFH